MHRDQRDPDGVEYVYIKLEDLIEYAQSQDVQAHLVVRNAALRMPAVRQAIFGQSFPFDRDVDDRVSRMQHSAKWQYSGFQRIPSAKEESGFFYCFIPEEEHRRLGPKGTLPHDVNKQISQTMIRRVASAP